MSAQKTDLELRECVRNAYGQLAAGTETGNPKSCCGSGPCTDVEYNKELGYTEEELKSAGDITVMGLGCGNPTAIADLKPGEVVLDLGCGSGFDCFLAAKKVGPTGKVIGVDMTPEMVSKARLNAIKVGSTNVEFRLGEIEYLPVADHVVDVIISNCVVNLSTDKAQVFKEAARVLKSGGRIAISDIVATDTIPENIKNDLALYSGCMAGATPINELKEILQQVGFIDIDITSKETSRQFIQKWAYDSGAENYVASAIIQAVKK